MKDRVNVTKFIVDAYNSNCISKNECQRICSSILASTNKANAQTTSLIDSVRVDDVTNFGNFRINIECDINHFKKYIKNARVINRPTKSVLLDRLTNTYNKNNIVNKKNSTELENAIQNKIISLKEKKEKIDDQIILLLSLMEE